MVAQPADAQFVVWFEDLGKDDVPRFPTTVREVARAEQQQRS